MDGLVILAGLLLGVAAAVAGLRGARYPDYDEPMARKMTRAERDARRGK